MDGGLVSEGGGQSRDLVSGGLQARRCLGDGRVKRRHGQGPAGLTRALAVGCDRLLGRRELGEFRAHARVLGLGLSQGAPLGQGAGSLPRARCGHLGDTQGLCVRLSRAITRILCPSPHRAGIFRTRVQLVGLLGLGCTLLGTRCIRVRVFAQGVIQRPHALESANGSHAPLLDAALRRGSRIDEGLREVHVDLRVEDVAQDLFASIRRGVEELGELALREHDCLQELVLVQTDNARNFVADVARTRRDRLHRAPPVRSVRILHDPRERRLRITLRLLAHRRVRGGARHPVDARRHLEDQVRLRRI